MIIDCPRCQSRVDAKVVAAHEHVDDPHEPPVKVSLCVCPSCNNALLGVQEYHQTGPDSASWTDAGRLWPEPKRTVSWTIPPVVRISLEEADRCFKAGAYSACAVMCGRALEGVCRDQKTKEPNLALGLIELRDREIIDKRLFEWSEALRAARNLEAHATDLRATREDARDLLDFVHAICDYVYVLSQQFASFMERQSKPP